jgi:hypothetical protein
MTEGIVNQIVLHVKSILTDALITDVTDQNGVTKTGTVVGAVNIGPLQGNPDPDVARISVEVHHNDPESIDGPWRDYVEIVEIGGAVTWARRFTVKIRCLLVNTRESLEEALEVASIVRDRAELALLKDLFPGIQTDDEYVSRGAMATSLKSDMIQGGGPPDSYDFHIKIYFDVYTTRTGVYS